MRSVMTTSKKKKKREEKRQRERERERCEVRSMWITSDHQW